MIDGRPLPVNCSPTSSQSKCKPRSPARCPQPKVMNGRHLANSAGIRKKETIEVLVDQNREKYRPAPGSKFETFKLFLFQ